MVKWFDKLTIPSKVEGMKIIDNLVMKSSVNLVDCDK
jgi:hypothetical protein